MPVSVGRVGNVTAATLGRPRLDRLAGGCDVVWCPAPAPVAVPTGTPLVLTVHDLSFEHRPGDFTAYERLWHRVARPAPAGPPGGARDHRVGDGRAARWPRSGESTAARVTAVLSGPGRPAGPAEPADGGACPARTCSPVGALEPRKQPELLARGARAGPRATGWPAGLVFAGEGALAGRLDGPAPRSWAASPTPGWSALRGCAGAGVLLGRGGLRLHAARGAGARLPGRGGRPAGARRDPRRGRPARPRRRRAGAGGRAAGAGARARTCASAPARGRRRPWRACPGRAPRARPARSCAEAASR